MKDNDERAPEDEAFWEDEGGDRTITSPFDPQAHGPGVAPSPVSEPPGDEDEATRVGRSDPALRSLAQPKTEPVAFGVLASVLPNAFPSSPPPPEPAAPKAAPALGAGRAHVVVGEGAVGDEATLAVPAPSSQATSDIAAALAATLGAGWTNEAVPPPPSSPGPAASWGANAPPPSRPAAGIPVPHVPPPAPFGGPVTSPAASTLGGFPPTAPAHPFGPGSSPDALRNLSPGAMPAAYPHPSSGGSPVHPGPSPSYPNLPAAGGWPPPPQGFPYASPGPHGPHAPHGPMAPMAPPPAAVAAAPRPQLTLLLVVGVVCVAIFVVGVILFVRTNF